MSRGEQKVFLKELGPFRTLALTDSKYAFLRHLCTLWFQCWPLWVEWYIDHKGMMHREQIWKVSIFFFLVFSNSDGVLKHLTAKDIMWAAFAAEVTPEHCECSWRRFLTTCEAHQGIYHVRISYNLLSYHLHWPPGRALIMWISSTMQNSPRYETWYDFNSN